MAPLAVGAAAGYMVGHSQPRYYGRKGMKVKVRGAVRCGMMW